MFLDSSASLALPLNPDQPLALVGAMDQEIERILQSMTARQPIELAGFMFYQGKLFGQDVVLLKSGIGKVNAAIGTTLLIDRFKPQCIINTGSAGGFDPALRVGDIVISSEVVHHDVDICVLGFARGQVADMPLTYSSDPVLVRIAEQCIEALQGIAAVHGLIGTGDAFMSDPLQVARVKADFPQIKAVEMEAAAIAQTCHRFGLPFIIIRSLSDIAGVDTDHSFETFLQTASEHSAAMVLGIVERLVQGA